MNNKEERNKKIIAIVLVVAVLFLGIYKLFFDKDIYTEEKIDTETISVLKDNNRFFTVSSCVSKYVNYLSISDTENLLVLLNEEYKEKNSIDKNNLYSYIGTINGTSTFSPKKMFEQRVSQTVYKYYIYGYVNQEMMDEVTSRSDYYLIVFLDEKNMTFSIEPYDGSMFK